MTTVSSKGMQDRLLSRVLILFFYFLVTYKRVCSMSIQYFVHLFLLDVIEILLDGDLSTITN
jgi:hypothetical protein